MSDESKFDILGGNHGRRVLRAKEEGDFPACYQCSVQKQYLWCMGFITHSAYGMDSLDLLEGTMYAERYIKVLEQLGSPPDDVYFSRTMQNHIL